MMMIDVIHINVVCVHVISHDDDGIDLSHKFSDTPYRTTGSFTMKVMMMISFL